MNLLKSASRILLVLVICLPFTGNAQSEKIEKIKLIIEIGNANELYKFFENKVDLNINGKEGTYSRSQAEGVLKFFFKKNPPKSFQINHKGTSKNGLVYAIGEYKTKTNSFRVWIRLRKTKKQFNIHEMSFVKE